MISRSRARRRPQQAWPYGSWSPACGLGAATLVLLGGCAPEPIGARGDGAVSLDGGSTDAPSAWPTDAPSRPDAPAADAPAADALVPLPCGCFDGPGTYCGAEVAARAAETGCLVPSGSPDALYACDASGWSNTGTCAGGCEDGESGAADACALPACDCFVRVSWCGASAARHGLTLDPPCRVPLSPAHDEDILGCDAGRWVVLETCALGCEEHPTGTPDSCVASRTPSDPGWPTCPHRGLLHAGLHPEASDRLRCAGVTSDRISQTIGSAPASAGYHAADGTADGLPYTAAVDLRTRDLSTAEIRALLGRLAQHGFAAWYRQPGADGWPASEAPHIHAVFAGVVMKSQLRSQVRDYLVGRNGLSSHGAYRFYTPTAMELATVRLLFTRHYTP